MSGPTKKPAQGGMTKTVAKPAAPATASDHVVKQIADVLAKASASISVIVRADKEELKVATGNEKVDIKQYGISISASDLHAIAGIIRDPNRKLSIYVGKDGAAKLKDSLHDAAYDARANAFYFRHMPDPQNAVHASNIIHEGVHAALDKKKWKGLGIDNELAAYTAQGIFLAQKNYQKDSFKEDEKGAILNAAIAYGINLLISQDPKNHQKLHKKWGNDWKVNMAKVLSRLRKRLRFLIAGSDAYDDLIGELQTLDGI